MLSIRSQLPVYSPIRFGSLLAGAVGALGFGRPLERLHEHLADTYGTSDLVLADSGTSALRLAISGALGMSKPSPGPGAGVVAIPAYCCYDVATAAVGAMARVRLYDVDPETLGPMWGSLDETLRAGAAAVVIVHPYGVPVDMERAASLAEAHGVLVIEDAAQGFGGFIGDRPLGAFGSLGVLSFGRGKGITGGGGGALLANDTAGRKALATVVDRTGRARAGWGQLLRLAAQWLFGRPALYGIPSSMPWLRLGDTYYREPWPPRGIARGAAAAVRANWEASMSEAALRRKNAARLRELTAASGTIRTPMEEKKAKHVTSALRQALLSEECADDCETRLQLAGLQAGYPHPLWRLGLPMADVPTADEDKWPGARYLARYLWTAPTHSRSDVDETAAAIRAWGTGDSGCNSERPTTR